MATKTKLAATPHGTGRRKSSVARVRVLPGSGKIRINQRELEDYISRQGEQEMVKAPLLALGCLKDVDCVALVRGGGYAGQAGAVALGVARALIQFNAEYEAALRDKRFLSVDSRRKERKKYGRAGARRGFQFSKR
jgi:small subunit ribosomal protein S9